MRGLIRFADKHRYFLASSVLLVFMTIQTLNEQWSNDFWEHSAVVRELITHPTDPRHPMLPIVAPHAYFSPYLLAVAVFARLLDLGPIPALQVAGLINLVVFLVAFRLFVMRLIKSPHAPFYALIFAIVLWGPSAWRWSGFINLNSLGFGLPFPSMFALAITLLSLVALSRFLEKPHPMRLLAVAFGGVLALLAHPITAVIGCIFAGALVIADFKPVAWRKYVALGGAGIAVVLLALAWPYFSLLDLLFDPSIVDAQSLDSKPLYEQVIQRTFPMLTMLPFLALRVRSNWRDPLVIAFIGGAGLYLLGALNGNFVYGRMIVLPMLALHITFGGFVADFEDRARQGSVNKGAVAGGFAAVFMLLVISLIGSTAALVRMVPRPLLPERLRADPRLAKVSDYYGFLTRCSGQYDVILTDLGFSSLAVPTFGGKIVSTAGPTAFVDDYGARAADVKTFFGSGGIDERRAILLEHQASYVLLNRSQFYEVGSGLGIVAARHGGLVLISTKREVCTADTT